MNRDTREFYENIGSLDMNRDQELVTVLSGEHTGAKVLLTDGDITASSGKADPHEILGMPEADLLREKLGDPKTLVVCGAGYVGQGVIRLGRFLGWKVIAVDDRLDYARQAGKAGADEVIADEFSKALHSGRVPYGEDVFFVVVTRGHRFDKECLLEIMKQNFGYVGMMGSRARSARMRQVLVQEGVPKEKEELLHAPVGLKIGAQTPEEIALSIVSEIVAQMRSLPEKDVFSDELLEAVRSSQPGKCVLATIVRRKGSTPRQAGSRMLVRRDRSTVGTIGGGCMEAEAVSEAVLLMTETQTKPDSWIGTKPDSPGGREPDAGAGKEPGPGEPEVPSEIFRVDLTGRTGSGADMLCGGIMEVLLEVL